MLMIDSAPPNDIHVAGRNARKTKLSKFLVFVVKDNRAPVTIPGREEAGH